MLSKSSDLRFEHMISSFHYGQVTGMEPAIRKPLLATCGLDKNIRIWNYVDRTLELYKVRLNRDALRVWPFFSFATLRLLTLGNQPHSCCILG
jgi:hypothetical protein